MPAPTLTELNEASQDVNTLESFVNDPVPAIITTRTGTQYPNLSSLSQSVIAGDAVGVAFDNAGTNLASINAQAAIVELYNRGLPVDDYVELRGLGVSNLIDGQVVTVTDSGIAGDFVLRNTTAHGLADNGGRIIVINADWYGIRLGSQPLNALMFGASGDGVSDDNLSIESNQSEQNIAILGRGVYLISDINMLSDNSGFAGLGNQLSILNCDPVGSDFCIKQNSDYSFYKDIRIQGAGKNLIEAETTSYFNQYDGCWFGPSLKALSIQEDFYWTTFTSCVFRDNSTAIECLGGQDVNAITFTCCTFYHFDPASAGPSVVLHNGDGVAFNGCHVQNQGMEFNSMRGIEITGGYWECYLQAAIDATNSKITISGSTYFPNATLFKFDKESISFIKGFAPNLVARDSDGILYPDNSSQNTAPVASGVYNLFADKNCSSQKAIDAFAYSPTGLQTSRSINANTNLEMIFSAPAQRAGWRIPNGRYISVYIKWRAVSGTARLAMSDVTDTVSLIHNSADDSEYRYCHWHCVANGANPSFIFDPQGGTATVEVSEIVATENYEFLRGDSDRYKMPSGRVALSGGTASVIFEQPPTGDYIIDNLTGDSNETFYYSSKGVSGFTINSSNASSTAEVYWSIKI